VYPVSRRPRMPVCSVPSSHIFVDQRSPIAQLRLTWNCHTTTTRLFRGQARNCGLAKSAHALPKVGGGRGEMDPWTKGLNSSGILGVLFFLGPVSKKVLGTGCSRQRKAPPLVYAKPSFCLRNGEVWKLSPRASQVQSHPAVGKTTPGDRSFSGVLRGPFVLFRLVFLRQLFQIFLEHRLLRFVLLLVLLLFFCR